jgi:molybdopterin converting factor small subunit
VKVRAYGKLADLLGKEEDVDIDVPCTVAELRAHLAATCPDAAEPLASKRVLACVGNTIVPDNHILDGGEPVELLAPVSGG